ncbi:GNAT family N-acetyltransferase [Nocardia jiangxiensis]|uniref:GNAT family N-acetyltransferase n=1 Tax=Nocardia jiangxiensis TaxID=282685 RepID=UPI000316420F|nr:GNAT family N-acetyltransferase [Nocardia jiangxiensis]
MTSDRPWHITPLRAEHCLGLAECHIGCWREAYRGLVPDHVLDAFDVDRRAEQWERIRAATRAPDAVLVALVDAVVVGFTGIRAIDEPTAVAERELNAMYVRAAWYGTGLAHDLMREVLDARRNTSLWVFEENPRAQAFYRKYGFELDGGRRAERFSPSIEVRMLRPTDPTPAR